LRQGSRLFSAGEKAEHFYMLLEGSIRIVQPRTDCTDNELARFTPGDTIGDFDFARHAEYNARSEAEQDSVLIMFPGYGLTMEDITAEEPQATARLLMSSIMMMTSRIRQIRNFIAANLPGMQELRRRAYEDPGTGLLKQTFLTDEVNTLLEAPTALFMLKPDRFKILVDSRGHAVGDEAMVRIAAVLKNTARRIGRGWPLRFKSNEVGLLVPRTDDSGAEEIALTLVNTIAALRSVPPQGDLPAFDFSATLSWAIWPDDEGAWEPLFQGTYALLMDTWRAGGNQIKRYRKQELAHG
jgi:diguanylate cyclase (GGDEF)-like protein